MKKKVVILTATVLTVVLAAGGVGYYMMTAKASEIGVTYQETTVQSGDISLDFTEEGTTAVYTVEQMEEFDLSKVELIVEKVYVSAKDEVETGDALYKLTDESVAEALAYYEEQEAEASKTKSDAQSAYDSGKVSAEYDLSEAKSVASTAQATYDAANATLDAAVTQAQTAITDAQTQIAAYQSNLDNDNYKSEAGVTEKKETLTAAKAATKTALNAYQGASASYDAINATVTADIVNLQNAIAQSTDLTTDGESIRALSNQLTTDSATLAELKAVLDAANVAYLEAQTTQETASDAYDLAKQTYQQAEENAESKIAELETSLTSLQTKYTEAVNTAETKKVENQKSYDAAMLEGEYAQSTYDETVNGLALTLEEATTELEEIQEAKAAITSLTDNVITASQSGTLAAVTYSEEDSLISDTALVTYTDEQTLMVSLEVAQENISRVAVGDEVNVTISGSRNAQEITGNVISIASTATSGASISNVTYTVVVDVDNSENTISSEATAYVTFTYGSIEDVDYIATDALSNVSGTTATVKQYDDEGNVVDVNVTIGEATDNYTVITEGLTLEDVCLIEMGGEKE